MSRNVALSVNLSIIFHFYSYLLIVDRDYGISVNGAGGVNDSTAITGNEALIYTALFPNFKNGQRHIEKL